MTLIARHCARCGKELTDAASMEMGIGPVCRDLDNALLARLIPSEVESANMYLSKVSTETLPAATRATFEKVYVALVCKDAASVMDWRETVKRIEWILSFGIAHADRANLTKVVAALGYVGLAALWSGDAATGETKCWFEVATKRLFVQGPRNKAANLAIKAIPGRKFHEKGSMEALKDRAAWSVPLGSKDAFKLAVITHYPNFKGLTEALAAADQFKAEPVVPVESAPKGPTVEIISTGVTAKVKSPYNAGFVAAIKALPYKSRAWNPVEKVWEVRAECVAQVTEMAKKFYGVEPKFTALVAATV